jgi:hypothetical protein
MEEHIMDQDRGKYQEDTKKKASWGERWGKTRPTKTWVFWSWVVSIVLTMIIGFAWGGWVTKKTAQTLAQNMADEAVAERLAPMCVLQFNADPGKDQKLGELKAGSSWSRGDYVQKQGWATMPGEEQPDRKVAEECAKLLMLITLVAPPATATPTAIAEATPTIAVANTPTP